MQPIPTGLRLAKFAALATFLYAASVLNAVACPLPEPAVQHVLTENVYVDKQGSIADPERIAANNVTRAGLNRYLDTVTGAADAFVNTRDPAQQECLLSLLAAWANENALLEGKLSGSGQAVRMWAYGTLAIAYFKAFGRQPPPPAVSRWFERLSDVMVAYLGERRLTQQRARRGRSNIDYWTALALGTGAVVLRRDDHWETAAGIYREAMADIRSDGTLPAELMRGRRALAYHAYATGPLLAFARMAAVRGTDLSAADDGKLEKLVQFVVRNMVDPQEVNRMTGIEQAHISSPPWLHLYPGPLPGGLRKAPGCCNRALGGDVRALDMAVRQYAKAGKRPSR